MKRHWFNTSVAWLLVLLQRAPMLRVAATTAEFTTPPRAVALLKSAFALTASLGAVHSLAGATQFSISNSNVSGTVGTTITPVAFTVTGAQTPAGSYRVTGTLPPGLTVTGANSSGIVNASTGSITGKPTASGSYSISIRAYEFTNAQGDSFGPATIRFTITGATSVAPAITSQPASQAATTGASVSFAIVATGTPAPTYQWRKDTAIISGATSATFTLPSVQVSDSGSYSVVVSNSAGSATSNAAVLTVTSNTSAPAIITQPATQHVNLGASVTLAVGATGTDLSYQWKKDGVAIAGATNPTLLVANANALSMGFYSVTVTNTTGSVDSAIATLTVNTGGRSRLINVSTRGYVAAGAALTPGFVLQGIGSKPLVIRAVGPTLGAFSVNGALADPMMEVIPLGASAAVASNDNWGGSPQLAAAFSEVGAFALAPETSKDATVVGSFNSSGATGYTVRITSNAGSGSGIALAEVYDDGPLTAPVRLVNVSTSGFVGVGDQALVPGFVIGGDAPKLLLIRAVGPGLAVFGVGGLLADPQLSVVPLGRNFTVAANDNWGGAAALQAAFTQAGAFQLPPDSNDAVVVVRLPPGGYTAVVSGVANTTGTALVEVYDLDP